MLIVMMMELLVLTAVIMVMMMLTMIVMTMVMMAMMMMVLTMLMVRGVIIVGFGNSNVVIRGVMRVVRVIVMMLLIQGPTAAVLLLLRWGSWLRCKTWRVRRVPHDI